MQKTALVTGCSSGIGHFISQELSNNGIKIIGLDYHNITTDYNFDFHLVDLTSEESVCSVFDRIGNIDYAINCAGISATRKKLIEFSSEEIANEWKFNFLATFNPLKYEILNMRKKNHGKIINISSITAHVGMENFSAYSSAKSSIYILTKVAAIENKSFGIHINSISPATIDTPMIRKKYNGKLKDYSNIYPVGKCGHPKDVYLAVNMLIENEFITGHDIRLDGGLTDLCTI